MVVRRIAPKSAEQHLVPVISKLTLAAITLAVLGHFFGGVFTVAAMATTSLTGLVLVGLIVAEARQTAQAEVGPVRS